VVSRKRAHPPGGPDLGGRVSTLDEGGGTVCWRSLGGSSATPYLSTTSVQRLASADGLGFFALWAMGRTYVPARRNTNEATR
jgi:hypothetical protein